MRTFLVAFLAVATLGACGGDDEPDPTSVTWNNYSGDLLAQINDATRAEDCETLQAFFDAADANDGATRNRTGEGNADLMHYIDESLAHAGCY